MRSIFICINIFFPPIKVRSSAGTPVVKYIEGFSNPYVKLVLACKICNKDMPIKYPGNWKQHYFSHSSSTDRPFKCQFCEKSFVRGDRLKNHVTKHHPRENSQDDSPIIKTNHLCYQTDVKMEDVSQSSRGISSYS